MQGSCCGLRLIRLHWRPAGYSDLTHVSHGKAWEDHINLLIFSFPSLSHSKSVSVIALFLYVLLPISVSATAHTLFVPWQVIRCWLVYVQEFVFVYLCFCLPCTCLPAHVSVRVKHSANYNVSSSIRNKQTDSVVQISLGHDHRLSGSSKPEVTTTLSVCRACTKLCEAYGFWEW